MTEQFPEIVINGDQIDAKTYVENGTSVAMFFAFLIAIIGTILAIVLTYGVLLIILLLYPLIAWIIRKKALAMVHGSGIRVSEKQFPEIHKCLIKFKERLGITDDVTIYIVEENIANAFVVKYGKKNVVLLTDDLIHGCIASGNPKALSFVIGHELGHIALNHNGVLRSWVSKYFKKLSRLDEYSADSLATALVQDKTIAFNGLLLLTVGYAMMPYVNYESVIAQAQEVSMNKYSKKAERSLTHPLLLNRLYRILL